MLKYSKMVPHSGTARAIDTMLIRIVMGHGNISLTGIYVRIIKSDIDRSHTHTYEHVAS